MDAHPAFRRLDGLERALERVAVLRRKADDHVARQVELCDKRLGRRRYVAVL